MPSFITLEVVEGPMRGKRFQFRGCTWVLVGRSRQCDVPLPDCPMNWDVSRKHCLIEVAPQSVTIRDAGSKNGTFVNEQNIRRRTATAGADGLGAPYRLRDGDHIRVGHTVFRLGARPGVEESDDATIRMDPEAMTAGV